MPKYDVKQVPREVLEEFLRDREELFSYDMSQLPMSFLVAYVSTHRCIFSDIVPDEQLGHSQLKVRESARVKLRTRAQVDADIAEAVRGHNKRHGFPTDIPERDPKILFTYTDDSFPFIIDKLLREETEG